MSSSIASLQGLVDGASAAPTGALARAIGIEHRERPFAVLNHLYIPILAGQPAVLFRFWQKLSIFWL